MGERWYIFKWRDVQADESLLRTEVFPAPTPARPRYGPAPSAQPQTAFIFEALAIDMLSGEALAQSL